MRIVLHFRNGFGFDIEHNEDIIHVIGVVDENGNEEKTLGGFVGIIVRLPLLAIYIGEFSEVDEEVFY
jgi:hypothetical protein